MPNLQLTFACGDYDRTQPLRDGSVRPEGIDLTVLPLSAKDIFWRMLRYEDFDVSEMSLSNHIMLTARGDNRFVGLPVFLSRVFRHGNIYVNTAAGIRTPRDLIGKRVAAPEYYMTALLWIRGLLQHEYGVRPQDIRWVFAGLDHAGYQERVDFTAPADVQWEIVTDRSLSQMLESGEVDAAFTSRHPACFRSRSPRVARLFPDYMAQEMAYYRKTRLFPIMHCVALRRSIYEKHPWVARSLMNALYNAKDAAMERLMDTGTLRDTVPWLIPVLEDAQEVIGADWWPYGVEANRPTLEAMIQYSYEQGLSERKVDVAELFAANTMVEYTQEVSRQR